MPTHDLTDKTVTLSADEWLDLCDATGLPAVDARGHLPWLGILRLVNEWRVSANRQEVAHGLLEIETAARHLRQGLTKKRRKDPRRRV